MKSIKKLALVGLFPLFMGNTVQAGWKEVANRVKKEACWAGSALTSLAGFAVGTFGLASILSSLPELPPSNAYAYFAWDGHLEPFNIPKFLFGTATTVGSIGLFIAARKLAETATHL